MIVFLCVVSIGFAAPPTGDDANRWILELGDPRYTVREQAVRQLWESGSTVESAVRKAAESSDPEVSRRARQLVEKYDWGIFVDTPPEVITQIGRYRGGDEDIRSQAIRSLIGLGRPAYAAIGRLASRAETPSERGVISEAIAAAVPDALSKHIRSGDMVTAEELLDVCLLSDANAVIDHYVAVVMMTGRMSQARTLWAERRNRNRSRAVEVAFALARAAGDYGAAKEIAESANRTEMIEQVLWDTSDWKSLATREFPTSHDRPRTPAYDLSLVAYLQRAAGDTNGSAKSLEKLRNVIPHPDEPSERLVAAHGLMMNERVEDAMAMLKSFGSRQDRFALLFGRGEYAAALAVAEQQAPEDVQNKKYDIRRRAASANVQLGRLERGMSLFEGLMQESEVPNDGENYVLAIVAAKSSGLIDFAQTRTARYLDTIAAQSPADPSDSSAAVLGTWVPNHGSDAAIWWRFFRGRDPQQLAIDRLKRVMDLLRQGVVQSHLTEELAATFLKHLPATPIKDHIASLNAMALAHAVAGQNDLARRCFHKVIEQSDTVATRMMLADFERGQKRFDAAAESYRIASEKQPSRPLPIYLRASCLGEAGRIDEAQALSALAFRISTGKFSERIQLAEELAGRGLINEARREREFVERAIGCRDYYSTLLLLAQGQDAATRKDFAQAAELYERAALGFLRFGVVSFSNSFALARGVRYNRARAELVRGHIDAAMTHANACLDIQPIDVSVPIQLMSGLVQQARPDDAIALYRRVVELHRARLAEFPDSPLLLNNLAWCHACCRRDLDDGVRLALRATQLSPNLPGYFDTLAEAYHQMGERENAIKSIRKAMTLDQANDYYKSQLRRFEAGDRTSLPAEPEE